MNLIKLIKKHWNRSITIGAMEKLSSETPALFEYIGNCITSGDHPATYGIETEEQYEGFCKVWKKEYGRELPKYEEAKAGPLFSQ